MRSAKYQVKKISKKNNTSTILNNSVGKSLELDFNEASSLCKMMNKTSTEDIRYELVVIYDED